MTIIIPIISHRACLPAGRLWVNSPELIAWLKMQSRKDLTRSEKILEVSFHRGPVQMTPLYLFYKIERHGCLSRRQSTPMPEVSAAKEENRPNFIHLNQFLGTKTDVKLLLCLQILFTQNSLRGSS